MATAAASRVEQIYLTYCGPGEGLRREPGFYVRAASTRDPEVIRFALDLPAYELPLGLLGANPAPPQAPRRLALVPAPGGRIALVHSALSMDRPGNTFTHVLLYPRLDLATALRSWTSPDWQIQAVPDMPQVLPPFEGAPRPGSLDEAALKTFLTEGATTPADQKLATVIFPVRLACDVARRRALLRATLGGCLQALQGGSRGHLFLLAEPGLAALLLYGVVRLLPEPLIAQLTFSTFETLRGSKPVHVAGFFAPAPQAGLSREALAERGHVVDTFGLGRDTPELEGDKSTALDDLVILVSRGDWPAVAEWHRLAAVETVSLASLEGARRALRLWQMLSSPQGQIDHLLALRRTTQGRALLAQNAGQVWLLIWQWSLTGWQQLEAAPDALRSAFCQEVNGWPRDQQRQVLTALLSPTNPQRLYRLDRLLTDGLCLPGAVLDEILTSLGGYESAAREFWLVDNHLVRLLSSLSRQRSTAARIWERFRRDLGLPLLLGNPLQHRLLEILSLAVSRLGAAVPPDSRQAIQDWHQLRQVFAGAEQIQVPAQELTTACQRLGLTVAEVLREFFVQQVMHRPDLDGPVESLAGALEAFAPPCRTAEDHRALLAAWLEVIEACPDLERKAGFQLYFLEHHIPKKHRQEVARYFAGRDRLAARVVQTVQEPEILEVLPVDVLEVLPVEAPAAVTTIETASLTSPTQSGMRHARRVLARLVEQGQAAGSYDFLAGSVTTEARTWCRLADAALLPLTSVLETFQRSRSYPGSNAALKERLGRIAERLLDYLLGGSETDDVQGERRRLAALLADLRQDLAALEPSASDVQLLQDNIDTLTRGLQN